MEKNNSFSAKVKDELISQTSKNRSIMIAELSAYITFFCKIKSKYNGYTFYLETENSFVASRFAFLLKRAFHIIPETGFLRFRQIDNLSGGSTLYGVIIKSYVDGLRLYNSLFRIETDDFHRVSFPYIDGRLIADSLAKRAFVKGAFISAGTISDPGKSYHFEININEQRLSDLVLDTVQYFIPTAKTVVRKNSFVVYIKEAEMISDMLKLLDANSALMEFENIRILHDIANKVNRQTNCDVANSQKTVSAASKQIDDILYIKNKKSFSALPDGLKELADLRLSYEDLSLKDLGQMLNPPISKSGVNHRMRKIAEFADNLRLEDN